MSTVEFHVPVKGVDATAADELATLGQVGGGQTREQLSGNAVTIGNGASGFLTWDTSAGPDSLLDLTVPAHPTAVAAGVYAVAVEIVPTAMTAGGFFQAQLVLDNGGAGAYLDANESASAANPAPYLSLSLVFYVPAGGVIDVQVFNADGAAGRDFVISQASVQRLS